MKRGSSSIVWCIQASTSSIRVSFCFSIAFVEVSQSGHPSACFELKVRISFWVLIFSGRAPAAATAPSLKPQASSLKNLAHQAHHAKDSAWPLARDDIANYERGRCDIPTMVLAELDRIGLNVSCVLNGREGDAYGV